MSRSGAAKPLSSSTLREETARGSIWLVGQALVTRSFAVVQQLLLAWLLAKEDFGLIGLAYTVTAFVNLMSNPGVDAILVQRPRTLHRWLTPAFWMSMVLGTVGALAMCGLAPAAAAVYDQPNLTGVILVIAAATPFQALQVVPKAILQTKLRFRAIVALGVLQSFLITSLTILAAYWGAGAYSFAIPMPIASAITAAAMWSNARPAVTSRPQTYLWKYLYRKSLAIGGGRLLNAIANQADYVALGLIGISQAAIGAYVFAFNIAIQPLRLLASSVPTVLFPGLSHLSLEPVKQVRAAIRATRLLAIITVPFCLLQILLAEPVFRLLFPPKWLDAVLLCQILTFGLMANSVSWPAHSLMMAQGRFQELFRFNLFTTVALAALLGMAGMLDPGTTSIAVAVTAWHLVISPLLYWSATRTHASVGSYVTETFRPLLCGMLAAVPVVLLPRTDPEMATDLIVSIFLIALSFIAIYSILIFVLWRTAVADLISQLAPHLPFMRRGATQISPE